MIREIKDPEVLSCPVHGTETTFEHYSSWVTAMAHIPHIVDSRGVLIHPGFDPNIQTDTYICTKCAARVVQTRRLLESAK